MGAVKRIIFLSCILLVLIACDSETKGNRQPQTDRRKPMAWGHNQTIYVFADNHVWDVTEPFLRYSMERYFFTTENESLFELQHQDIAEITKFYRFKNLIFLGDINSNQPVSQYIKKVISEQAVESVSDKKASMFMNNNHWANDQLVLFILGDSPESIRDYLFKNQDTYFQIFKDRFIARITFQSQRLKGYKDSFFTQMPFRMYIPENYRVFRRDIENNFISFIWRSVRDVERNPDKYISVYWEFAENNPVDENWIVQKRAEIAWKYHDEDEFIPAETIQGLREFNEYEAWFMRGMWQNKKHFMGGTFQSFAFYDENLKTAYLIDTSVYFPAGYKIKYIMELEGLVQTIITKAAGK